MQTETHPQARTEGLVVRELPDEVLVYDLERHKAHCLNSTAAAVWRHCDGQTGPEEIGFRLAKDFGEPVEADVVWLALDQLSSLNLLETPVVRAEGVSRSQLLKRAGLVAAAISVPAVVSLAAPTAAMAAVSCPGGCGGTGCVVNADCNTCTTPGCQACQAGTCVIP
jgi:hypothetical protein